MLSVVIPAWNAAARIPRTLAALKVSGIADEIVVADADSQDGTAQLALQAGAKVILVPRGRGIQLRAGAAAARPDRGASFNARGVKPARGDWLLFLHADAVPGPGFGPAVARFIADPANRTRAGFFRLRLDDPARAARLLEWLANWRARVLGLPYGDQGLLIARALYDSVGGFPPLPLMEDVALARRLGRGRLVALEAELVTSAERYRREGYLARPLRNLACLALYFLGVPPARIARLYD